MADIDAGLPVRSVQDVDERLQTKLVDFTTPSQGAEIDTDGDLHVKAKLRDNAGNAFGVEANPIYVTNTDNPNAEIHDFNQSVAIAKDATSTHSYTNASGAKIRNIHMSASGLAKFEVSFGVTSSEVLKYVVFNSVANPNVSLMNGRDPITLGTGDSLIITKTNLDNQAQDIYSTINGESLA